MKEKSEPKAVRSCSQGKQKIKISTHTPEDSVSSSSSSRLPHQPDCLETLFHPSLLHFAFCCQKEERTLKKRKASKDTLSSFLLFFSFQEKTRSEVCVFKMFRKKSLQEKKVNRLYFSTRWTHTHTQFPISRGYISSLFSATFSQWCCEARKSHTRW